ncbi:amidase [Trichoderma gamsii]|uniref:Amidase n=1 Tax=Trichoderma gamsii TaxID=398673 RepID=A0A2P4Z6R3_9HYPO|nr:amidase [Trichoderma gamsii]PON19974.1 amidase [Trichoderma gamsii]
MVERVRISTISGESPTPCDNPVKEGSVESLLASLGLSIDPSEAQDFRRLLAAVHDCAETVAALPDYQLNSRLSRYPRQNIRQPAAEEEEQGLGQAWAHRFFIAGDREGGGRLIGRSVNLKDVIAVAGVPQLQGSRVIPSWTPEFDATVVTRLLEAGADIRGTSTCEDLCHSTSSFTSAQGTVENPHARGYSAGGSTSGGAALVAAGLVDVTIGTDQGGSIRVPAAMCGCVGIKPTHGRVPFTGISSGDALDDHVGPMTRNTLDAALCLDVISGYDGIDDRALASPKPGSTNFAATISQGSATRLDGFRVGLITEAFQHASLDPVIREAVLAAAKRFQDLGAVVEDVSIPDHNLGPAIWTIQQRISGTQTLLGRNTGRRELYPTGLHGKTLPWTADSFRRSSTSTKNVIINGLHLMSEFPGLYGKSVNIGRQLRDAYEAVFREYDVLITPTVPVVAPRHGRRGGLPIESATPSMGLTINTAIFNVTGHPAMSIPVGFAPAKDDKTVLLPMGMQLVGGLWQELKILRAGHVWESCFDWRHNVQHTEGLD